MVDFRWSRYGQPAWCTRRHGAGTGTERECQAAVDTSRDELGDRLAHVAAAQLSSSTLYLEGGGIEVNGRGLALVSEPLIKQRDPGVGRTELETAFRALPGISKVIWLAVGLASDPHLRATITGHCVAWGTGCLTDVFVRHAYARTVLLTWPDEAEVAAHPVARLNRQRMQRKFDILPRSSDVQGQPLRVVERPTPRSVERRLFLSAATDDRYSAEWTAVFFPPRERRRGGQPVIQVASSSDLNFDIVNRVVVPGYEANGTPQAVEQRVRNTLEQVLSGRRVVLVDALGANWVDGAPHCVTLNEPAL